MDIIRCIDNFSVLVFPFLIIASLVVWCIGLHAQYKRSRETEVLKKMFYKKRFLKCGGLFICCIGFMFAINGTVKFYAQKKVDFLLKQKIKSVQINGDTLDNSAFLEDIKHIAFSPIYHHSHPNHSINVILHTTKGDLELILSRDSSDADEYWVFDKEFHVTSINEIGKISSTALNTY